MKVLFDHIVFQSQKIGGVSKALVEMMSNLPSDIDIEIAIKESDNVYLRECATLAQSIAPIKKGIESFFPTINFRGKSVLFSYLSGLGLLKNSFQLNMSYCKEKMNAGQYDVFQPTHYNSYFLKYNKKPFVFIIHDIIPELFPEFYNRKHPDIIQREKIIGKASHIVAISNNTKKDIIERWHLREDNVSVIPWGAPSVDPSTFNIILPYRYILYVGGRNRYKRFDFFVREARRFLIENPDVKVVCTGRDFTEKEKVLFEQLGLKDRFVTMFVDTNTLYSLYHHAICFVFPSIYEGFGLPVLEAMACGCPALISDASCFPEIGGDAAFYIETDKNGSSNINEMLNKLASLSDGDRSIIISKGLSRAKSFSWEKTALEYSKVYRSLID